MVCQEMPVCELLQQQDDHNYKIHRKGVTIQTCDHCEMCKNKKSNTSIKSTHNSLQNYVFKFWTIFRWVAINKLEIMYCSGIASTVRASNSAQCYCHAKFRN